MNLVIPAQLRAARALVGLSQEQLAASAGVGLSTVRDAEGERRSGDTAGIGAVRRTLENAGVEFLPGAAHGGPGVRLVGGRPNVTRRPTRMHPSGGYLPFSIEWCGREVLVILDRSALDDVGHLTGQPTDAVYLELFEKHRAAILDGAARALKAGQLKPDGRLYLEYDDITG